MKHFFRKSAIEMKWLLTLLLSVIFGTLFIYGLWRLLANVFSPK